MLRSTKGIEDEFRRDVLMAVNTGRYNPRLPQTSFIKIFNSFVKKMELGKACSPERNKERQDYFSQLFIKILKDSSIELNQDSQFVQRFSEKIKKAGRADWITDKVILDAVEHERDMMKHIPENDR